MFVVSLSLLNFCELYNFGAHPLAMDAHSGNARGGIHACPCVRVNTRGHLSHPCAHEFCSLKLKTPKHQFGSSFKLKIFYTSLASFTFSAIPFTSMNRENPASSSTIACIMSLFSLIARSAAFMVINAPMC